MKKLVSGALALMMAFSLAACGGGGDEGTTTSGDPSSSTSTTGGTAKDTFTVALDGEPNYLDNAIASDNVTATVTELLTTPIFSMDENGQPVNTAITDYEVSEDGLTYTFHFREGMVWSDGTPLTAHDYEYGLKHAMSIGVADASYVNYAANYITNAEKYYGGGFSVADMDDMGYTATDDLTLVATLKTPCTFFTQIMMLPVFAPAKEGVANDGDYTWAEDVSNPTCGPYMPESIDRTSEIVLVKNPNYVDADKVLTEKLVLRIITDTNAQLLAYQNGEVDFARKLGNEVITIYDGQDDLVMPGGIINYLFRVNSGETGPEALKDVNVRKAIAMAINREEICLALDAGELYKPLYGIVPAGIPDADGDFRTNGGALFEENLDEAKALMEAAGYSESNRLALTYSTNSDATHETIAQVVQQQLAQIYIDLTINTMELRTFFDSTSEGNFEVARSAFSADYLDPMTYLENYTESYQAVVTSGDAHYSELIESTRTMTDNAQRMEVLHEAENYFVNEMQYQVPLLQYGTFYLVKPGTEGIVYTPQGGTDFSHVVVYE